MQEFANPPSLRNAIFDLLSSVKLATDENVKLLDYTIQLFKNNGLFSDYYGYHNVDHELEVTYVTLLSGIHSLEENYLSKSDLNYLFASALLHDFDPDKSMDKPHEKNVIRFISKDQNIQKLLANANLDQNLICAIISRTVYPWIGDIVTNTEKLIQDYFSKSEIKDNKERQKHFRDLGHFLSISDRIGGYSLGDFQKAMEMAKMNAHSSSWHPAFIVRRSVVFFEDMLNNEPDMCQRVLNGLPKHMRKNFLDNIVGFMKLRQEEIQIYNQFVYDGLPLVPCIQKSTLSDDILDELLAIYRELPKPLQFTRDDFIESISDPETILNMLRIGDSNGRIIGFAKGGPLEKYNFDLDFEDRNRGKNNTVFLEPVAIKNGYWGFHGGRELRQLFMMQVQSKGYKFMTSFAMRDVIDERKENDKNVVFVKKFDPERWDYFRVTL
ncbi:MAG: hypothetical protein VX504_01710 [Thermoproteota archaeon]|jgi:hypothetical protein|nr:hypothetical protein [Thermoproteota archaeon]MEC8529374.1 hypothetical protein [Thermoproteota archaeon]MEC9033377.1 hypothetical protein [Thermoproteota archaeon]MEC9073885.1 hypothetical protein [Thermoproteota archaeon]MEC9416529.1 hypothetical protein [Thermoproteota archaeon]|tara:strand:- start:1059 stop:2375 length:1317 start_codon:yes stop_codon:yes gene_type:complete